MTDFETKNRRAWERSLREAFGASPPQSASWTDLWSAMKVLDHFMGYNVNHALLPGGGGMDFDKVGLSREPGCLRFNTGDRSFYLAKPKNLTFEYIHSAPVESFFLLELDRLKPSGVYEVVRRESEQLVDVDDEYIDYSVWEHGVVGHEEDGTEIPLSDDAEIAVRLLHGKILIVAKSSLWNGDTSTYDGRHDHLSASDIRGIIERSLAA